MARSAATMKDVNLKSSEPILKQLRNAGLDKHVLAIERALLTEATKQTKAGNRQLRTWEAGEFITLGVSRILEGKDHGLSTEYLHLQPLVGDIAQALKIFREGGTKEKVPDPVIPQADTVVEKKAARRMGRIKDMTQVLDGIGLAIKTEGYSILVGEDRGQFAVTLMGVRVDKMITVVAESLEGALNDAVGKMLRLA